MIEKKRRKEQKEQTRQALKEAALRSFAAKGWEGAQIAQIAKEAKVAVGTFYVHFANKDDLLLELLVDFNEDLVEKLICAWEKRTGNWLGWVEDAAWEFLGHWEEHRDFVKLYAQKMAMSVGLEDLRDGINPQTAVFLSGLMEQMFEEAVLSKGQRTLLVQGLLAMWLRVGMQYLFGEPMGREVAQGMLVKMTRGALMGVLMGFRTNE